MTHYSETSSYSEVLYVSSDGEVRITLERASTDALITELEARASVSGAWTYQQRIRIQQLAAVLNPPPINRF